VPLKNGKTYILDSVAVFLLAAALIWPLFQAGYFNNWASIESTFIADARFLAGHWPHPNWQPLWYGGTRFDYIYPPALRYGTAALSKAFGLEPVDAYHIYTALLYALGIAGAYVLIRAGTRSRGAAWLGAAATALVSPTFLVWPGLRYDSEFLAPQRLHVLVKYGEGPHISAVALLAFALAAGYWALKAWRPAALAAAAVLCALVPLTNFYGATSLAILFPVLVWSVFVAQPDRRVWLRAAAIAGLAAALAAFWLSPSYLRVTVANLSIVSAQGNACSVFAAAVIAAVFAWASWRWAAGNETRTWTVFAAGAALFLSLNTLGNHFFNFRVAGEPGRLVPELDFALILAALEGLRWLWRMRPARAAWLPRTAAAAIVLVSLAPARHYVRHAWQLYPLEPDYRRRVEYRVQDWIHTNLPGSRVFVHGSIRFWYDAWHDLAQVGGGSEQGLLNPNTMAAVWENTLGPDPMPGRLWLTAFAADAVVVPDKTSQEIYHDFPNPGKFAGALPVLHDDSQGNVIYRVPRRYPGLARVVDCRAAAALGPVRHNSDVERLGAYVNVLENGPEVQPAFSWEGSDAMRIRAPVGEGQCLAVAVTYDPYWRAYAGDRRLSVRRDALGQMLVAPPAGAREVRLAFELPLENAIGRGVSCAGLAAVALLLWQGLRRRGAED
jgi:hypothetical protein